MEKLFYIDSYIKNFTAEIKEIKEVDSKYRVLLDKTAFFPGGGGQYNDLGLIDNIKVVDVYEENDKIYHVLDKKQNRFHKVKCEIDWDRREYGMQHHLGQHIISACFNNEYKAKTVGFHLGNEASTVDIEGFFKEEDILKIENMCNEIIRENIDRSPIYSGNIKGTGPRYCPSIEDKVVRFADKKRHQVFLEPEGLYTNEMYIGGMSSSLPEDVQYRMYHTVPGLEHAAIVRNAYAIEYDCINPLQLKASLEFKNISGFFSAGQANGSSGYEEAAAQGIIAGINAARKFLGKEPVVLDRSQAYIGVLIDDLVTKGTNEPYRMMTSRAEYRLLLRQDNADMRLTGIGHEIGLIDDERYEKLLEKEKLIEEEVERMKKTTVGARAEVQELLAKYESTPLQSGTTLAELLKRPELSYEIIKDIDKDRKELPEDVKEQVNIELKYEGYIKRQLRQVEQYKKLENKKIPEDIDYDDVYSLRKEAVQKLKELRPASVGQASRISGVSPADISVLLIYLGK